jgi:hypothetical protein
MFRDRETDIFFEGQIRQTPAPTFWASTHTGPNTYQVSILATCQRARTALDHHFSAHALLLTATSTRTHPHRPPHSARTLCRWSAKISHERLLTVINHQAALSFKHCLSVEHSPRKPHTAPLCMCCATPCLNYLPTTHHMNPAPFCAGRWVLGHAAHARTRVHWAKQSDASVPTALRCRCVVSQPRHQRVDRTSVSCGDTRRTWLRRNSGGRVLRKQATQLRVTATGCVSARLLQV